MTTPPEGIDAQPLETIRLAGGDALVARIVGLFLEHAPQRLATARNAVAAADAGALEQSTHSLKSSAAQLGARELAEICRDLEQRAARKDLTGTAELMSRAEAALDLFITWVSRHREVR